MEVISTTSREDSSKVAGMRVPARAGQKEARAIGEDLTRQGRIRMDCFQVERRLKSAYASLGEIVCQDLGELRAVNVHDGRIIELIAHIRYYQDELTRLRAELRTPVETI
jgi:hypothetical protein